MSTLRTAVGACLLAASPLVASAQLISQWNFNSAVPDSSASTGSIAASSGSGTASVTGNLSASFAAGSPRDLASDNSAWNLTRWPAQGVGAGTAGAQFMVSTVGFTEAIRISFDLRQTATASERFQLQVTSDGVNFLNVSGGSASFGAVGNNSGTSFGADGLFINTAASSSQAFVQNITYSLLTDGGFSDNANFGFRLVSVFEGAAYDAAGASSNYATSGVLRLDMVTVSAAPSAVPEPATGAWMLGTLGLFAAVYRRKRSSQAQRTASIR